MTIINVMISIMFNIIKILYYLPVQFNSALRFGM